MTNQPDNSVCGRGVELSGPTSIARLTDEQKRRNTARRKRRGRRVQKDADKASQQQDDKDAAADAPDEGEGQDPTVNYLA